MDTDTQKKQNKKSSSQWGRHSKDPPEIPETQVPHDKKEKIKSRQKSIIILFFVFAICHLVLLPSVV